MRKAPAKKPRQSSKKPSAVVKTMLKIIAFSSLIGASTYLGSVFSHSLNLKSLSNIVHLGHPTPTPTPPTTTPPQKPLQPVGQIKQAKTSVFSEGTAPVIVGDVPEGWRVETSSEIKAKFAPQKVTGSDDITFVVPVYTLAPEDRADSVYIIEPGRTKDGEDEGGTVSGVLSRLEEETSAVGSALDVLTKAISGLSKNSSTASAPSVQPSIHSPSISKVSPQKDQNKK